MAKRYTFFSFHYQNDIWRANQVRQLWRFSYENEREAFGYFDASLWERSKRTSDESLKTLIRSGVKGTSVTCVLAGTETYSRRWVRYEIAQSIIQGNGLLTVHIDWLKDRLSKMCPKGPNPLSHMAVYADSFGRLFLAEHDATRKWINYKDYTQQIFLPKLWTPPANGTLHPISFYCKEYCHFNDSGAKNLLNWLDLAAKEVGR